MFVFRSISLEDEKAFIDLAFLSKSGITSLPKDILLLKNKFKKAINSFESELIQPFDELYLFVIENTVDHSICGISGIASVTGKNYPNYYYVITQEEIDEEVTGIKLPIRKQIKLIEHANGPSELCSLFLHPKYRKIGIGKLLSLGRLLFVASFSKRFKDIMIACLRGAIDSKSNVIFWEHIGRKFFNVDFEELEKLIQKDIGIVKKILPHNPIYTLFLPQKIQNIIGQVHPNSLPAKIMLMNQGFNFTNEIDPFDGGPKISAIIENLLLIANCKLAVIENIKSNLIEEKNYLICNNKINFRASLGQVFDIQENLVSVSFETANLLHLKVGDQIRYYNLLERKL